MDVATTQSITCILIGDGGHASVVLDCLRASDAITVAGVVVEDATRTKSVLGVPVLGGDAILPGLRDRGITHFVVGVGGVGDNRPRKAVFERALAAGLSPLTVKHPSSVVSPFATISDGCQLLPGSIVNAGARLGANVILNSGAIVEHDCTLGDHVHLATGARLSGSVSIGHGAHIGVGAVVMQYRDVGEWAIVGAGAVVVKNVAPHMVVVGVPAQRIPERQ